MRKCLYTFKDAISLFPARGTLVVALLSLLTMTVCFGQEDRRVSGRITDENGEAVPGANIVVAGTTTGTQSDADGKFALLVPGNNDVLNISFIGYASQTITIGSRTQIEVKLVLDTKSLDEVVVVGYGEQSKANISGSVSTINTKQITQNPAPNLSNSLVGNTAGIIATQNTGEPGNDNARIFIRGIGTTGGADPIYVIDGIVRSSADFFQLNANEIESVSVLKDAASAAVFGMRAGNGVILVTTKRGKAGSLQISYTANFGVQERTREPEFLNSWEFASLKNIARVNAGQAPEYSDEDLQKYKDGSSPDTHPNTNWQDLLRDSAPMQQHNLSASGGTDRVQFATSLSYLTQDGITASDNFQRYNFRSNIDANITNTTRVSFDISGRKQEKLGLGKGDELFRWLNTQPTKSPLRFSNGGLASGPAYISEPANGYRKDYGQAFRSRLQLRQELPFIQGLAVKFEGSFDITQSNRKNWYYPVVPFYSVDGNGNFTKQPLPANSLDVNRDENKSTTLQTYLDYERTFNKLDVSALVLYTQTVTDWENIGSHREGYTVNIDELNFGGAENRNNSGYTGSSGRQGVVGRVNLKWSQKYILESSVRVDGSEQFASDKRWGVFPSVSAAYVISEESFMDNMTFIDFLKLRASYGVLGNDQIGGDRFLYLQPYNVNAVVNGYRYAVFGDGKVYPTVTEGKIANPDVTWETVRKLDIGFDATILRGKGSITFDYFHDKRSDILGNRNRTVPGFFGIDLPVENLNKIDNKGIEVSLGYEDNLTKDLSYTLRANLTYAKNKVVYIDEPQDLNPNLSAIGLPLYTAFGYRALGIFQTQEEVESWATQPGDNAPGDIKIADINADGVINAEDRVPIGVLNGSVPNYILGLNGQLRFKNFELNFLLQGATGVKTYASAEGTWPFFVESSVVRSNLDYWTPENTDARNPRILVSPNNMNHEFSSFWVRDASYMRLKNVELAYNAPNGFLGQSFIKGLRVYVNANNVALWTNLDNWDPEYSDGRAWTYPQLRVWNAGFAIRF
jgi:TonB-linked SusC/RagA family outer membrane protein